MTWIQLLRPESRFQLLKNYREQEPLKGTRKERDFVPAARLYIPYTYCEWLLTEVDSQGMAFGLCQIQVAELGSVWLPELAELDVRGMKVAEDHTFVPTMTISQYADAAKANGGLLRLR